MTGMNGRHKMNADADDQAAVLIVDDALRTQPLEDPPPGLALNVMNQVRQARPMPRFRLTWLDYALSLFAAWMLGAVVLFARTLPPELTLRIRLEAVYWLRSIQYRLMLLPSLPFSWWVLGAALVVVALALLLLVTFLPRRES